MTPSFSYAYTPFMCYTCLAGGDSQTTIAELACSSLGARAANQRLWWEQRMALNYILHSQQREHMKAWHPAISRSWESLQIHTDSTPPPCDTSAIPSLIKTLLRVSLLITNPVWQNWVLILVWYQTIRPPPPLPPTMHKCVGSSFVGLSVQPQCSVSCGLPLLFVAVT